MGASVQPEMVDPQDMARIQSNVAKMRAAGAPESDVLAYLQHEDEQSRSAPAQTPNVDTSLSLRNLGRSAVQGATLGFGDEMGLVNGTSDEAFAQAHPVANMLARLGGGVTLPALALLAAPELATAGGAAAIGGATGLLSAEGEGHGSSGERIKSAILPGLIGAATGYGFGYAAPKATESIATAIADRNNPSRAVARNAAGLIDPDVKARLAQADAIAPGGASIATTAVPADGTKLSRFLPMLRAVGANPEAGARAEANIVGQQAALKAARDRLGSQMEALQGDVPITPELRKAMMGAQKALGAHVHAPAVSPDDINPLGLEKSEPFTFDPTKATMSIGEMRDALSRLRFLSRGFVRKEMEARGVDMRNVGQARRALQDYLYAQRPDFAPLDRDYAITANQSRQANQALKTVQRSRSNYAANSAYGATSGSLGGSLPRGTHGVLMTALDKILTNKAGAADAVANLIATPGGPEMVDQILARVPKPTGRAVRAAIPVAASSVPALRGLLFPSTQP